MRVLLYISEQERSVQMKASKDQLRIFKTWKDSLLNIIIDAVAGSGKSTVIYQLIKQSEGKFLYLAFNGSIMEAMQNKLERGGLKNGKASTLHSLGLKTLRDSSKRVTTKPTKNYDLIKKFQEEHPDTFKKMKWKTKLKYSFALNNLWDASRQTFESSLEVLKPLMMDMGNPLPDEPWVAKLWPLYYEFCQKTYEGKSITVDFIDMIYLPVKFDMKMGFKCKYLAVDEAQDLNFAQHKFIEKIIKDCGIEKWIAVGDRRQAIYGFSGSHSDTFSLFEAMGNTVELPLSICYRSTPEIVAEANKVYDVMEAFQEPSGDLTEVVTDTFGIRQGAMIICRNTTPLLKLFFRLVSEDHPAYLVGKDISEKLLRVLKPHRYGTMREAMNKLIAEKDREAIHNLAIVMDHLCHGFTKVQEFELMLKRLFVKKENATHLMTIHKSKGLEADTVYILNENLIPSKFAVTEEQKKQEQNLKYVARTRAKKKMYYLNLKLNGEDD